MEPKEPSPSHIPKTAPTPKASWFAKNICKPLKKELFKLTISQIVAAMFIFGTFGYEIYNSVSFSPIPGSSSDSDIVREHKFEYVCILAIYIITGLRIFLTNWEVEEDPTTTDLKKLAKNYTPVNGTGSSDKKYWSKKMNREWGLRFSWVFLVYLFPFLVAIENVRLKEEWILGSLLFVYFFMVWWDYYILKSIFEEAKQLASNPFSKESKIENDDIDAAQIFSYSVWRRRDRGCVKNLEHKIKLWQAIEVLCLILTFICFITIMVNSIYSLNVVTVLGGFIFAVSVIDYIANWYAYWPRFVLCLVFSLITIFIVNEYYLHLRCYPKAYGPCLECGRKNDSTDHKKDTVSKAITYTTAIKRNDTASAK